MIVFGLRQFSVGWSFFSNRLAKKRLKIVMYFRLDIWVFLQHVYILVDVFWNTSDFNKTHQKILNDVFSNCLKIYPRITFHEGVRKEYKYFVYLSVLWWFLRICLILWRICVARVIFFFIFSCLWQYILIVFSMSTNLR